MHDQTGDFGHDNITQLDASSTPRTAATIALLPTGRPFFSPPAAWSSGCMPRTCHNVLPSRESSSEACFSRIRYILVLQVKFLARAGNTASNRLNWSKTGSVLQLIATLTRIGERHLTTLRSRAGKAALACQRNMRLSIDLEVLVFSLHCRTTITIAGRPLYERCDLSLLASQHEGSSSISLGLISYFVCTIHSF